MSQTKKRIGSLFLVFCMVFAMMPMTATAADANTLKDTIGSYNSNLAAVVEGNTVTVTGTVTDATTTLELNIDAGVTVVWAASITGDRNENNSLIILLGSGIFVVATGGSVTATEGTAIYRPSGGPIIIDGGNVTAAGSVALSSMGNVTVKAGTVRATGTGRAIGSNGSVTVEGGTVETAGNGHTIDAAGSVTVSGNAVVIATGSGNAINAGGNVTVEGGVVRATTGYAIYATGTTTVGGDAVVFAYGSNVDNSVISGGSFTTDFYGVIIAWDKPAEGTPTYGEGTSDNLTKIPDYTTVTWAKVGGESGIFYERDTNTGFLAIPGVTVTASGTPVTNAATPIISTHPAAETYTRDASATPLSVEASVTGGGALSYQWYSNENSSNAGGTLIDGATNSSYTPSTAVAGTTYYYCVVTNTDSSVSGNQTASVTSSAVAIVVNEAPVGPIPTFTISGTITGSDTGSGVAGAIIELKDEYGDSVAITGAGPTGEYNFDNILAGTYNIEVNAPDYNGSISVITVLNYDITNHNFILVRPDYYGIYGLVVGDVVVTAENKDNITGSDITGTISYNPATKTLTLENATIGMSSYHPIVSTEDLTVRLIDSSVLGIVWSDDQGGQIGTGISGYKNITLTGDGNLTIYNNESGIQAKNITIDMGGTLTIDELGSSGMACTLKANGGTITINKGTLNLKSKLSNGLYGNSIVINGGNITAYSEDGNNAGLFAFNRAPSFSRDYWYKVYAGDNQASAVDITAPNSRTYTNSKYVRIEQSSEGTGLRGGGHGGGGGSGGSGGGTTSPATPTPPTSPNVGADGSVSQTQIAQEAAAALGAATGTTATVRTRNASEISPATLDALAGTGAQADRQIMLHADTMTGTAVQGRLYVEPAKLTGRTEPLKLGVYTEPAKTAATTGLFERFFDNNITTISLEQQGSFGTSLQIAAKVDLSKLDVTALVFYSYDKATNTYRRIQNPAYWVDTNGYLHFNTALAGDIIISEGPLTRINGGAK